MSQSAGLWGALLTVRCCLAVGPVSTRLRGPPRPSAGAQPPELASAGRSQ